MKIYDCFMYLDEDIVLDLRLNYLDNYIDKFVIVESKFTHSGKERSLNFNIKKFEKFKKKIIYLVLDREPPDIENVNDNDNENTKNSKYILNGMRRDFYQRNFIVNGLKESSNEDFILISDLDEIPKLDNIDLFSIREKFVFFKQKMFYYKFNLCSESVTWTGTRGCKKKHLKSPQWLRNIKDRSYPVWRLDIIFSKNKYSNINLIQDGGWHFSYIKTPEDIEKKLKSYAHHREYELNNLGIQKIKHKIMNKESIYDLRTDMKNSKFNSGQKLAVSKMNELPSYIQNNLNKYKQWLE
tara:strand:- start:10002 stop:10892 length:891 start_codon:yes stop_codon:yes gene_type:complete